MENMKKFGVIVLTIYVTLVTIAAALFGSLYFLNLKKRRGYFFIKSINQSCLLWFKIYYRGAV